jgi:hypothetical protein
MPESFFLIFSVKTPARSNFLPSEQWRKEFYVFLKIERNEASSQKEQY